MNKPLRQLTLEQAIAVTTESRNKDYGEPKANFDFIGRWQAEYLAASQGKYSEAHQAVMLMAITKIGRIATGAFKHDTYIDAACYPAIAYEVEAEARAPASLFEPHAVTSIEPSKFRQMINGDPITR